MTPYHIKVAPAAERQITELHPKHQKTLIKYMAALSINPRPLGAEKLEGMTGLYCDMYEQMRIIYKIENQEILILLVK